MSREIIKHIDTQKGPVSIYTEKSDPQAKPRWFAVIQLPGGLLFPMIERDYEISEDEVRKMVNT